MTSTPACLLLAPSSSALAALPDAERLRSVADLHARPGATPGTVVVGPDVDLAELRELLHPRRPGAPPPRVVLERHHPRPAEVAAALAAGVSGVVAVGDLGALVAAVAPAARVRPRGPRGPDAAPPRPGWGSGPETRRPGRVVTVFSAKGGCGTTTMATNVAVALAEGGRRRVALVDLDLALGDVAVSLRIVPEATVADAVAAGPGLDAEGLRRLLAPHPSGLLVLPAPTTPDATSCTAAVTGADVVRILGLLGDLVDHVVVDTPSTLDAPTLAAIDRSDAVVLLTTPDVPALKHLTVTLAALGRREGVAERCVVVLNRSDAEVGLDRRQVERTTGRTVAAQVPGSRDVPASVNRGMPLVRQAPGHPVSRAVRDLVNRELVGRRPARVVDIRDVPGGEPGWRRTRPLGASVDLLPRRARPAPH